MEKIESVFFYSLEKSIKSYRQFAQGRLIAKKHLVTIDQWLVLKTLNDNPDITQLALAEKIFKDKASVTRIVEILVRSGLLKRSLHERDKKRFKLTITQKGRKKIKSMLPAIRQNRKTALKGLSQKEIKLAEKVLLRITENCRQQV